MPLTQHPHQDQYETGGHPSSRTTPSSESEQRATSGSRKRVPVACERCRKRKIKCSGNEGNNQSCANCINAGHEESCRFLRVSSIETAAFSLRGWQGPSRYSPYSLPTHHRLNYVSVPSRYSPPNSLQYPTVPASVDYGGYANPSPNVDWTRTPYGASYSPYPDDEEPSPYPSQVQPPPYILPHTDPMSTTNAYYMHAQGVRPQHSVLWPEPQHCMPQAGSQLNNPAYAAATQGPQPVQALGIPGHSPSDRILPTPVSARSIVSSSVNPMDSTPDTSSSHRSSTYWTGENNTSTHQPTVQVDTGGARESSTERTNRSYRLQDMPYAHMGLNESLASTSLPQGLPVVVNEAQPSTTAGTPEESHAPNLNSRNVSHDNLTATPENTSAGYSYTDPMAGRSSRLRSTAGRLSNGSLYCRTQNMVARREPAPDDCSPDCSSCQTDSTRTSVISMSNNQSGY
ncbi:hypothetical protein A1O3_04501 [Capronia epimyces CBS 606.96]|uniref:Zn(2)-C6 fungal-type domain-containing protein n=1 Tax=Capronia epimyces CBS 606.96 TaxID=1182542 RepID=W9YE50_9EURO|nr:uncharacterized protein A1O3_04501 [Capronia epimyces CBS 606.96]EXJ87541.1 hypothetical protein A1O3_04501 [Capronia epimyces CBS 606.96]